MSHHIEGKAEMKTFTQFIHEAVATTLTPTPGPAANAAPRGTLWADPTAEELKAASQNRQYPAKDLVAAPPARMAYICLGWITDRHLYVWSERDEHSYEDVQTELEAVNSGVRFLFPVELYYFPIQRTVALHVITDVSADAVSRTTFQDRLRGRGADDKAVVYVTQSSRTSMAQHPGFKYIAGGSLKVISATKTPNVLQRAASSQLGQAALAGARAKSPLLNLLFPKS